MTVGERFELEQVRSVIRNAAAEGYPVATIVAALAIFGRRIDGRPWAEADVAAVLDGPLKPGREAGR